MLERPSAMFWLILLLFTVHSGNSFPTSGMGGTKPTGFYCFVMPDMTWQCKCPEAERVYVLYRFPQFALVCNSYNQLEFLSRAGSNHGNSASWSPKETYAYQIKHTLNLAQSLGSWRGKSGADKLPEVRYNYPNSASNSHGSESTDTAPTSTYSSTPTTPSSQPEPIASASDNSHKSASASGSYGHYDYSAPSEESGSSAGKESTVWSSSTLPTTETPKQELPPKPEEKPKSKVPSNPVPVPEPTEKPPSVKNNKSKADEDKGCTYMGRHMKTGQSFKPPWGCTLYCNGNNSLFRRC